MKISTIYNKNSVNNITIKERFFTHVDKEDANGCKNWNGYITDDGYGMFNNNGTIVLSHRFLYVMKYGEIPKDKPYICHKCNNPKCVNIDHLYAGTQKDNMKDRTDAGNFNHIGEKNPNHKFTQDEINQIRKECSEGRLNQQVIANKYNVDREYICLIVNNKLWKDDNYERKYICNPYSENNGFGTLKLTWSIVDEIRERYKNNNSIKKLSIEYKVNKSTIYRIINNKIWHNDNYKK